MMKIRRESLQQQESTPEGIEVLKQLQNPEDSSANTAPGSRWTGIDIQNSSRKSLVEKQK